MSVLASPRRAASDSSPSRRRVPSNAVNGRWRATRVAIIASQFNASISEALAQGAAETLRRAGVPSRNVCVLWVPGAFELPVVATRLAESRRAPDAIVAVGALIRGATPQYAVLAHAVAQGLSQVSVKTGVPVTFGIIVATTVVQARARAGSAMGNRGSEAALAALATLRLFNDLKLPRGRVHSP